MFPIILGARMPSEFPNLAQWVLLGLDHVYLSRTIYHPLHGSLFPGLSHRHDFAPAWLLPSALCLLFSLTPDWRTASEAFHIFALATPITVGSKPVVH